MSKRHGKLSGTGASTTAGRLSQALNTHTRALQQADDRLAEEIAEIEHSRSALKKELEDRMTGFVRAVLPDLDGEDFDDLARLAQQTPALTDQGLAYVRKTMMDEREKALQGVSGALQQTVDIEGFKKALTDSKTTLAQAEASYQSARSDVSNARNALNESGNRNLQDLSKLDRSIRSHGGKAIGNQSRSYYGDPSGRLAGIFPVGLLIVMGRYIARNKDYRDVRQALIAYGDGEDGKDAFADLAVYKEKAAEQERALEQAQNAEKAAGDIYRSQKDAHNALSRHSGAIKTDDEILEAVQGKVVSYLSTPDFMKAAADHYGEDFPQSALLIPAKLSTLDKLEQGVQEKKDALLKEKAAIADYALKVKNLQSDTRVNVDLDDFKRRNEARSKGYDRYAEAARSSRNRTSSYDPGTTIVYRDSTPDLLELYLWQQILGGGNDREVHHHHYHDDNADDRSLTRYSADLFGVGQTNAEKYGLPDSVFEIGENDDDIFDFDAGDDTFDFGIEKSVQDAFDFEAEEEESRRRASYAAPTWSSDNDEKPFDFGTFGDAATKKNDDLFNFGGSSGGNDDTFDFGGPSGGSDNDFNFD